MLRALTFAGFLCLMPSLTLAQGTSLAFGAADHDSSQPVEVASDQLAIDQNTGLATFTGNVVVGQGDMRLAAPRIVVEYEVGGGDVKEMRASGGVTFTSGEEAAEAREAVYRPGQSRMTMTGDVIVTQGANALSGNELVVNLDDGTGVMQGRVRTIFQQGSD